MLAGSSVTPAHDPGERKQGQGGSIPPKTLRKVVPVNSGSWRMLWPQSRMRKESKRKAFKMAAKMQVQDESKATEASP